MRLVPRPLVVASDWLLRRVSPRLRTPLRIALMMFAVAFVAFEASRVWVAGQILMPLWRHQADQLVTMFERSPWIAVTAIFIATAGFVLPLGSGVFLWRTWRGRKAR